MEKILNFECVCGRTYIKNIKLIMVLPCEHIFHDICIKKHKYTFCPICDTEINGNFRMTDSINTDMDAQRYADMLSVSNYCELSDYNASSVIDNALQMSSVIFNVPMCSGIQNSRNITDKFLSLNNTDVYVRGLDRLNNRDKKVFIANHTSYMIHHNHCTTHHTTYIIRQTSYTLQRTAYIQHCASYCKTPYNIHHTTYIIQHTSYTTHNTS